MKTAVPAVRLFLSENPDWSVVHHTQANHGLNVLSRDPRDKPALPGTIKMATKFTKSLAAPLADGLQKVEAPESERRLEIYTDVIASLQTRQTSSSHYITFSVSKHGRCKNVTPKTRQIIFQSPRVSPLLGKSC